MSQRVHLAPVWAPLIIGHYVRDIVEVLSVVHALEHVHSNVRSWTRSSGRQCKIIFRSESHLNWKTDVVFLCLNDLSHSL